MTAAHLGATLHETPGSESSRILTPDQRVRVFVSSTLQELAPERAAACAAIEALHLMPVLFELGARPHAPQNLYRAYLEQSHVFVGIYWQSYGWLASGATISGVEDEYVRSASKPRLVYVKEPAPKREEQLCEFLDRLRGEGSVSYKNFSSADELAELLRSDLAVLLAERFTETTTALPIGGDDGPDVPMRRLPTRMTSFIGRAAELEKIEHLLAGGGRLLTLTGPGGIGKTRLAIEMAERLSDNYGDGVAFVPLESLASPKLVLPAVGGALAVRDVGGEALEGLVAYLQGRSMLLVLDNFEHVIEAAPEVASLLQRATGVTVLVTSRELLRLQGELEFRVPPLSAEDEAVTLFAARASTTRELQKLEADDLPIVAEICRRLDCVPLAIELAAARMRLLTPRQLLERLSERLAFPGPRDAPARQQTLEAAIAWSYELLEPVERLLLERLGVFRGSFTLESAEAICEPSVEVDVVDALSSLLDKSLVYRVPGAPGRFAMLSMIREFAYDRLTRSGELEATLESFTAYYIACAAQWDATMRSVGSDWIAAVDDEADNARAAVARLAEQGRSPALATMIRGLWGWLWLRGQLDEGREWVQETFRHGEGISASDRAWMLLVDGCFAYFQAEFALAASELEQAHELFETTGDPLGAALALTVGSMVTAAVHGKERALSDLATALTVLEEAGDPWGVAIALSGTSRIRSIFNDFDGAEELLERTLVAAEELGDPFLIVLALANHVYHRMSIGDAEAARTIIERALGLVRSTGVRYGVDDLLEVYARLEADAGDHTRAAELVGAAEKLREAMRAPLWGPLVERHTRLAAELQDALGTAAFDAARARGRSLPLDHWCEPKAASAT